MGLEWSRGERAVTVVSGAIAGAVLADTVVPRLVPRIGQAALFARLSVGMRDAEAVRVEEFPAYVGLLLFVLLGALAANHSLRWRVPKLLWPAAAFASVLAMSWRAAIAAIVVAPPAAWMIARAPAADGAEVPRDSSATIVAGGAAAALAYCAWITLLPRGAGWALAAALACAAAGGALIVLRARTGDADARTRDALGLAPLLFLPLVALAREPSPRIIAAALATCAALRWILERRPPPGGACDDVGPCEPARAPGRLVAWLAPVLVPASLLSILVMPLRFRELDSVNHGSHEAMHEAWINSVAHGKWPTTDASTAYGPLREALLAAWMAINGVTLEQMRIGLIAMNVAALPLLLAMGWRVARGRWALHAAFALSIVQASPLRFFLDYEHRISLGWVDVNRLALPLASVVFGVPHLVRGGTCARWYVLGWGAVAGAALLYSQEFGLCAVASATGATLAHALFGASRASVKERMRHALTRIGTFAAGAAAPLVVATLLYTASGRGDRFLSGLFRWVALAGAGVHEATAFPLSFEHLERPLALATFARQDGYPVLLYAAAPTVAILGALALVARPRGAFGEGAALRVALVLFSFASFRVTLERADPWHLTDGAFPAVLVGLDLAADVLEHLRSRRGALVAAAALVSLSIFFALLDGDVRARLGATARGIEAPSRGAPYRHASLPRAGDVYVHPNVPLVVAFVQERAPRDAPIFCRIAAMLGGDWYFFADRRNPTRFDTLAEIVTRGDQREVLEDLRRDPPALVLGVDRAYVGEEVARFLDERYGPPDTVAGVVIAARRPAPP